MNKIIAFVHIEKTAGISINQILRSSFGIRHCDIELINRKCTVRAKKDIALAKKIYPKLASIAGHWISPINYESDDLLFYTFLRNPIERTLSHYQYQIQRMGKTIEFEEWIKIEKYRNFQTKKLAGSENLEKAISMLLRRFYFIGITEHFQESLLRLNILLNGRLNIIDMHSNRAGDNSIKLAIRENKTLMALMYDSNKLDIELYEFFLNEFEKTALGTRDQIMGRTNYFNLWGNRLYRNLIYKPLVKIAR